MVVDEKKCRIMRWLRMRENARERDVTCVIVRWVRRRRRHCRIVDVGGIEDSDGLEV